MANAPMRTNQQTPSGLPLWVLPAVDTQQEAHIPQAHPAPACALSQPVLARGVCHTLLHQAKAGGGRDVPGVLGTAQVAAVHATPLAGVQQQRRVVGPRHNMQQRAFTRGQLAHSRYACTQVQGQVQSAMRQQVSTLITGSVCPGVVVHLLLFLFRPPTHTTHPCICLAPTRLVCWCTPPARHAGCRCCLHSPLMHRPALDTRW